MSPRPECYARDLRTLSGRPALATRVTCARPTCCARSSAHDMGTAHAVCARPGFWVCTLCTQPSFNSVHCLQSLFWGNCSWTLFMNTVHRDLLKKKKKKSTKLLKIFLCMI